MYGVCIITFQRIHDSCIQIRLKKNAKYDWREYGEQKLVPGVGRASQTQGGWDDIEPTLVAESVEPEASPPELSPVRSHGQGFQLR